MEKRERAETTVGAPGWSLEATEGERAVIRISSRKIPVSGIRAAELSAEPELRHALRELRKNGTRRLDVVISCTGGSVRVANGLARALDRWKGQKRCLIDGECSSAATIIAFLPEWEVSITLGSRVMVHKPKTIRYTHRAAGFWEAVIRPQVAITEDLFASLLHKRTGRPEAEVRGWIERSRSFTAAEAVGFGLCDELTTRTEWEASAWRK